MIRTIIVDDDVEMLIGLANIIDWNNHGFELIGQFENGLEALQFIKKRKNIDLIITDISMPLMDGLELIKEVKKVHPKIESIILTCYKEFDYVKEAIRLNTSDYVLKYTMTEEELITVLNNVKSRIEADKNTYSLLTKANRSLEMNKSVIKNRFYRDITEGLLKDKYEIEEKARQNNINISFNTYRVISFNILNIFDVKTDVVTKEISHIKLSMDNILEESLGAYNCKDTFWYKDDIQVMIFWELSELNAIKKSFQTRLTEYSNKVREVLDIPVAICISKVFQGIEMLEKAIIQLNSLASDYFYKGEGIIVRDKMQFKQVDAYLLYQTIEADLKTALQTQDILETNTILSNLFTSFEREQFEPICVVKLIKMIIIDIEFVAKDQNIELEHQNFYANTLDGWQKVLVEMVQILEKGLCKKKQRKEIVQALAYVNNHLHEAINCEIIADKVKLNRSYFSRLFKQELGMTFTDYLMKVRINKATMLLRTTDLPNEEISRLIGLENVTYFYKIYRRMKGITPGEIRKN